MGEYHSGDGLNSPDGTGYRSSSRNTRWVLLSPDRSGQQGRSLAWLGIDMHAQ
ncbi:MAG: hypothetical protein NVS2B7_35780 [Herpetosiphon sp.]